MCGTYVLPGSMARVQNGVSWVTVMASSNFNSQRVTDLDKSLYQERLITASRFVVAIRVAHEKVKIRDVRSLETEGTKQLSTLPAATVEPWIYMCCKSRSPLPAGQVVPSPASLIRIVCSFFYSHSCLAGEILAIQGPALTWYYVVQTTTTTDWLLPPCQAWAVVAWILAWISDLQFIITDSYVHK